MKYYNQRNYPHILYPSEEYPEESISLAGCGPVSCSMLVENLTEHAFSPIEAAEYALEVGSRDDSGTNMTILGPKVAEKFGFHYHTGNDEKELLDFLGQEKDLSSPTQVEMRKATQAYSHTVDTIFSLRRLREESSRFSTPHSIPINSTRRNEEEKSSG